MAAFATTGLGEGGGVPARGGGGRRRVRGRGAVTGGPEAPTTASTTAFTPATKHRGVERGPPHLPGDAPPHEDWPGFAATPGATDNPLEDGR